MLISEIRDEIIQEVGGDTADTALQALILTFIKGALRILPAKARSRILVGVESMTLSSGGNSVAAPSGFIREVSAQSVWRVDSGKRETILRYQRDNFQEIYTTETIGSPQYFRVYAKTFEFNRKADQDYTIYVECFKEISSIIAGDTFVGNDTEMAAVKELTKKIYFFDYEEDKARGETAMAIASDLLSEIDADYMEEELGTHVEES
jgi:hypothetical protein